jgi:hypothetical protein
VAGPHSLPAGLRCEQGRDIMHYERPERSTRGMVEARAASLTTAASTPVRTAPRVMYRRSPQRGKDRGRLRPPRRA